MPNLGGWEILAIVFLALIIFGPSKLPQLARSFAQAIQEFKNASKNVQKEITSAIEEDPKADIVKKIDTAPKAS